MAKEDHKDPLSIRCQRFTDAVERYAPFHEEMDLEARYALKLDHYHATTKDSPERFRPRGRQLKKLVKHVVGDMLRQKIYLDVRPQDDEQLEPEMSEMAKKVLEWHIHHPTLGYKRPRALMVLQAVAARMSAVEFEYDPSLGMWGEICCTWRDGRLVMWEDGFDTPHDPRCPWATIAFRMRRSAIEAMEGWKNTKDLKGDSGFLGGGTQMQNTSRLDTSIGDAPTAADVETDDPFVTVVKMWERGVPDTYTRTKDNSYRDLPPGERYMECKECGWRGGTADQEDKVFDQYDLCPTCGGIAERNDGEEVDEKVLAYRRGKRFTIFAPYEKREFVHLKKWPQDTTEIPLVVFQFDPFPGDPVGGSLTYDHKTMQAASNMLLRIGLENMKLAKPYVGMPHGARDWRGQPWEFGEWQGLGIHFDPDAPYQDRQLQLIQGNGLPNAWSTLDQSIEAKLQANTGTADLGFTPQNSKDIAASTISQMVEQGEIPTQEALGRLQLDETPAFQALYEMIQATYTPARWREFQGEDGLWTGQLISADNLPYVNVAVTANPDTARSDMDEIRAWKEFASAPPPHREFMAKRLNIPITDVQKLNAAEQQMMAEQADQMIQQAMTAQPSENGPQEFAGIGGSQ